MTDIKPTITANNDSTVTIEGEIPEANFTKHRGSALKALGKDLEIDGFRKGHIPEDILIKHVGDHALLHEMAERALAEHYGSLIMEHNIDAIGRPTVSITKLAFGNPLGFKITTAVLPRLTLPDYKTIAPSIAKKTDEKPVSVSDADVDAFIKTLLAERAKAEKKEGEVEITLTDELAKTFGDFKDANDMREKIREGMTLDTKRRRVEEKRLALLDALLEKTTVTLPDVLISAEQDKLMAQFGTDLARMGLTAKDYFERIKKTEDEVRNEFRADAEKRAKVQLLLNEIARAENITPKKDEIEKEVDHILSHHKDAERESVAIYVTTLLTNQKVLEFLETLSM